MELGLQSWMNQNKSGQTFLFSPNDPSMCRKFALCFRAKFRHTVLPTKPKKADCYQILAKILYTLPNIYSKIYCIWLQDFVCFICRLLTRQVHFGRGFHVWLHQPHSHLDQPVQKTLKIQYLTHMVLQRCNQLITHWVVVLVSICRVIDTNAGVFLKSLPRMATST